MQKYDKKTLGNVYHVSEYCDSIQKNMLKTETIWGINPDYMEQQERIMENVRSTLVDWII